MEAVLTRLTTAITIATGAHTGQVDKQGEPYIFHSLRVMMAGATPDEQVVGVLHDVLEDTPVTLERVRDWFGPTVAEAVDALTRRDGETYSDFIDRVALNPLAVKVKLNDLYDNVGRIDALADSDPDTAQSLAKRYAKALGTLHAAEQQEVQ